ncbi:MAG: hypothetical protein J6J00_05385 [Treponema sp.]|nr:hypothetical protein [Treponema sp.]
MNIDAPEKSALILENPAKINGVFSNLCYLPQNQTLYFGVHNGGAFVNGVQIFQSEGIYVLKKDSGGNFSKKGLRRFAKLEPWLVVRAKTAYFDNAPTEELYISLHSVENYVTFIYAKTYVKNREELIQKFQ